jgi:hypothetical protein
MDREVRNIGKSETEWGKKEILSVRGRELVLVRLDLGADAE